MHKRRNETKYGTLHFKWLFRILWLQYPFIHIDKRLISWRNISISLLKRENLLYVVSTSKVMNGSSPCCCIFDKFEHDLESQKGERSNCAAQELILPNYSSWTLSSGTKKWIGLVHFSALLHNYYTRFLSLRQTCSSKHRAKFKTENFTP